MDHPLTLALRKETLLAVVHDICNSLKTHGVKRILILNGHGRNVPILEEGLSDFRKKLGIRIELNSYWDGYTPEIEKKYMQSGKFLAHAAEWETSCAMAAFPERVHWEGVDYAKAKKYFHLFGGEEEAKEDERFHNEALMATVEKGEAMLRIAIEFVTRRLREINAA
jgi:creatinine amidohydrolase